MHSLNRTTKAIAMCSFCKLMTLSKKIKNISKCVVINRKNKQRGQF